MEDTNLVFVVQDESLDGQFPIAIFDAKGDAEKLLAIGIGCCVREVQRSNRYTELVKKSSWNYLIVVNLDKRDDVPDVRWAYRVFPLNVRYSDDGWYLVGSVDATGPEDALRQAGDLTTLIRTGHMPPSVSMESPYLNAVIS